ncbi:conserved hypothetical protein [Candidatus Terasakiella magnetica]|nr:conserved hypothetical protein [Candidatus Terasakiella magnetica]
MQYTIKRSGTRIETVLTGRLTFSDATAFPKLIDDATKGAEACEIDVSALTFIDSTGLSLFVHIYDQAQATGQKLVLRGAVGQVKESLKRSNFEMLFEFR